MNFRKITASAVSLIFFAQNILLAHSTVWSERKVNRTIEARPILMAAVPKNINLSPSAVNPTILPDLGLGLTLKKNQKQLFSGESALSWVPSRLAPFASIQDVYLQKNPSAKTVFLIQDVHLHTQAQLHIAGAIEALTKKNVIPTQNTDSPEPFLIAMEGARSGPIDLSELPLNLDPRVFHRTAEALTRGHIFNGAELAVLRSRYDNVELVGVETPDDYQAHVQTVLEASQEKNQTEKDFGRLSKDVKEEINHLPKELKSFEEKRSAYANGTLSTPNYVFYLDSLVPAAQPNVKELISAALIEGSIQFDRVERERARLITALASQLTDQELADLGQWSLLFRAGSISYTDYYQTLKKLSEKKGQPFSQYPELNLYVQYVLKSESIDHAALFKEIHDAEILAENELHPTLEQKRILDQAKELSLARKLIDHTLTESEWADYQKGVNVDSSLTKNLFLSFSRFYECADHRNQSIARNFAEQLNSSSAEYSVLLVGGFHSEALLANLQSAGFNTILVSPKITDVTSGLNSLDVLASGRLPLDRLFAGEKLFLPTPPSTSLGSTAVQALAAGTQAGQTLLGGHGTQARAVVGSVQATASRGSSSRGIRVEDGEGGGYNVQFAGAFLGKPMSFVEAILKSFKRDNGNRLVKVLNTLLEYFDPPQEGGGGWATIESLINRTESQKISWRSELSRIYPQLNTFFLKLVKFQVSARGPSQEFEKQLRLALTLFQESAATPFYTLCQQILNISTSVPENIQIEFEKAFTETTQELEIDRTNFNFNLYAGLFLEDWGEVKETSKGHFELNASVSFLETMVYPKKLVQQLMKISGFTEPDARLWLLKRYIAHEIAESIGRRRDRDPKKDSELQSKVHAVLSRRGFGFPLPRNTKTSQGKGYYAASLRERLFYIVNENTELFTPPFKSKLNTKSDGVHAARIFSFPADERIVADLVRAHSWVSLFSEALIPLLNQFGLRGNFIAMDIRVGAHTNSFSSIKQNRNRRTSELYLVTDNFTWRMGEEYILDVILKSQAIDQIKALPGQTEASAREWLIANRVARELALTFLYEPHKDPKKNQQRKNELKKILIKHGFGSENLSDEMRGKTFFERMAVVVRSRPALFTLAAKNHFFGSPPPDPTRSPKMAPSAGVEERRAELDPVDPKGSIPPERPSAEARFVAGYFKKPYDWLDALMKYLERSSSKGVEVMKRFRDSWVGSYNENGNPLYLAEAMAHGRQTAENQDKWERWVQNVSKKVPHLVPLLAIFSWGIPSNINIDFRRALRVALLPIYGSNIPGIALNAVKNALGLRPSKKKKLEHVLAQQMKYVANELGLSSVKIRLELVQGLGINRYAEVVSDGDGNKLLVSEGFIKKYLFDSNLTQEIQAVGGLSKRQARLWLIHRFFVHELMEAFSRVKSQNFGRDDQLQGQFHNMLLQEGFGLRLPYPKPAQNHTFINLPLRERITGMVNKRRNHFDDATLDYFGAPNFSQRGQASGNSSSHFGELFDWKKAALAFIKEDKTGQALKKLLRVIGHILTTKPGATQFNQNTKSDIDGKSPKVRKTWADKVKRAYLEIPVIKTFVDEMVACFPPRNLTKKIAATIEELALSHRRFMQEAFRAAFGLLNPTESALSQKIRARSLDFMRALQINSTNLKFVLLDHPALPPLAEIYQVDKNHPRWHLISGHEGHSTWILELSRQFYDENVENPQLITEIKKKTKWDDEKIKGWLLDRILLHEITEAYYSSLGTGEDAAGVNRRAVHDYLMNNGFGLGLSDIEKRRDADYFEFPLLDRLAELIQDRPGIFNVRGRDFAASRKNSEGTPGWYPFNIESTLMYLVFIKPQKLIIFYDQMCQTWWQLTRRIRTLRKIELEELVALHRQNSPLLATLLRNSNYRSLSKFILRLAKLYPFKAREIRTLYTRLMEEHVGFHGILANSTYPGVNLMTTLLGVAGLKLVFPTHPVQVRLQQKLKIILNQLGIPHQRRYRVQLWEQVPNELQIEAVAFADRSSLVIHVSDSELEKIRKVHGAKIKKFFYELPKVVEDEIVPDIHTIAYFENIAESIFLVHELLHLLGISELILEQNYLASQIPRTHNRYAHRYRRIFTEQGIINKAKEVMKVYGMGRGFPPIPRISSHTGKPFDWKQKALSWLRRHPQGQLAYRKFVNAIARVLEFHRNNIQPEDVQQESPLLYHSHWRDLASSLRTTYPRLFNLIPGIRNIYMTKIHSSRGLRSVVREAHFVFPNAMRQAYELVLKIRPGNSDLQEGLNVVANFLLLQLGLSNMKINVRVLKGRDIDDLAQMEEIPTPEGTGPNLKQFQLDVSQTYIEKKVFSKKIIRELKKRTGWYDARCKEWLLERFLIHEIVEGIMSADGKQSDVHVLLGKVGLGQRLPSKSFNFNLMPTSHLLLPAINRWPGLFNFHVAGVLRHLEVGKGGQSYFFIFSREGGRTRRRAVDGGLNGSPNHNGFESWDGENVVITLLESVVFRARQYPAFFDAIQSLLVLFAQKILNNPGMTLHEIELLEGIERPQGENKEKRKLLEENPDYPRLRQFLKMLPKYFSNEDGTREFSESFKKQLLSAMGGVPPLFGLGAPHNETLLSTLLKRVGFQSTLSQESQVLQKVWEEELAHLIRKLERSELKDIKLEFRTDSTHHDAIMFYDPVIKTIYISEGKAKWFEDRVASWLDSLVSTKEKEGPFKRESKNPDHFKKLARQIGLYHELLHAGGISDAELNKTPVGPRILDGSARQNLKLDFFTEKGLLKYANTILSTHTPSTSTPAATSNGKKAKPAKKGQPSKNPLIRKTGFESWYGINMGAHLIQYLILKTDKLRSFSDQLETVLRERGRALHGTSGYRLINTFLQITEAFLRTVDADRGPPMPDGWGVLFEKLMKGFDGEFGDFLQSDLEAKNWKKGFRSSAHKTILDLLFELIGVAETDDKQEIPEEKEFLEYATEIQQVFPRFFKDVHYKFFNVPEDLKQFAFLNGATDEVLISLSEYRKIKDEHGEALFQAYLKLFGNKKVEMEALRRDMQKLAIQKFLIHETLHARGVSENVLLDHYLGLTLPHQGSFSQFRDKKFFTLHGLLDEAKRMLQFDRKNYQPRPPQRAGIQLRPTLVLSVTNAGFWPAHEDPIVIDSVDGNAQVTFRSNDRERTQIWDLPTVKSGDALSYAFSRLFPDGTVKLAIGHKDGHISIWQFKVREALPGTEKKKYRPHDQDAKVKRNIPKTKAAPVLLTENFGGRASAPITSLSFDLSGSKLVTADLSGRSIVWNVHQQNLETFYQHDEPIDRTIMFGSGRLIVFITKSGVYGWRPASRALIFRRGFRLGEKFERVALEENTTPILALIFSTPSGATGEKWNVGPQILSPIQVLDSPTSDIHPLIQVSAAVQSYERVPFHLLIRTVFRRLLREQRQGEIQVRDLDLHTPTPHTYQYALVRFLEEMLDVITHRDQLDSETRQSQKISIKHGIRVLKQLAHRLGEPNQYRHRIKRSLRDLLKTQGKIENRRQLLDQLAADAELWFQVDRPVADRIFSLAGLTPVEDSVILDGKNLSQLVSTFVNEHFVLNHARVSLEVFKDEEGSFDKVDMAFAQRFQHGDDMEVVIQVTEATLSRIFNSGDPLSFSVFLARKLGMGLLDISMDELDEAGLTIKGHKKFSSEQAIIDVLGTLPKGHAVARLRKPQTTVEGEESGTLSNILTGEGSSSFAYYGVNPFGALVGIILKKFLDVEASHVVAIEGFINKIVSIQENTEEKWGRSVQAIFRQVVGALRGVQKKLKGQQGGKRWHPLDEEFSRRVTGAAFPLFNSFSALADKIMELAGYTPIPNYKLEGLSVQSFAQKWFEQYFDVGNVRLEVDIYAGPALPHEAHLAFAQLFPDPQNDHGRLLKLRVSEISLLEIMKDAEIYRIKAYGEGIYLSKDEAMELVLSIFLAHEVGESLLGISHKSLIEAGIGPWRLVKRQPQFRPFVTVVGVLSTLEGISGKNSRYASALREVLRESLKLRLNAYRLRELTVLYSVNSARPILAEMLSRPVTASPATVKFGITPDSLEYDEKGLLPAHQIGKLIPSDTINYARHRAIQRPWDSGETKSFIRRTADVFQQAGAQKLTTLTIFDQEGGYKAVADEYAAYQANSYRTTQGPLVIGVLQTKEDFLTKLESYLKWLKDNKASVLEVRRASDLKTSVMNPASNLKILFLDEKAPAIKSDLDQHGQKFDVTLFVDYFLDKAKGVTPSIQVQKVVFVSDWRHLWVKSALVEISIIMNLNLFIKIEDRLELESRASIQA